MPHFPTNFIISPWKQIFRFVLIILGLIFVVIGFFESLHSGPEKTLWVIDNSLSMAVSDIHTASGIMLSRLDRAKQIASSSLGSRVGEQAIMTAAYGPRLELPMTDDLSILSDVIHGISLMSHGGGSSLATPLETIRLLYGNIPNLHIIWITDGEFSDSGSTLSGFTTSPDMTFIGVGTRSGGPILEGYDMEGRPRYKESGGNRVNSIRDDVRLGLIADTLNARLILVDSDTAPDLSLISKGTSSIGISGYLSSIGILLIIVGLIFPRFIYQNTQGLGK